MQAALDIANAGYDIVMVERLPSIGGRMAQLSETFPTLDCSQCILTPRTVEVGHHPNIRLMTYSEVISVKSVDGETGKFGNRETAQPTNLPTRQPTNPPTFRVRIRRHAAYVDWDKCTGCGFCQEK